MLLSASVNPPIFSRRGKNVLMTSPGKSGQTINPPGTRFIVFQIFMVRPSVRPRRPRRSTRCARACLRLCEETPRIFQIPGTLEERLGIPFAARSWRREEVAAVDVNRSRHPANGIDHGMDDVASEHRRIAGAERARTRRLDGAPGSPPEHVVLSA